jgi:hypothetical protein
MAHSGSTWKRKSYNGSAIISEILYHFLPSNFNIFAAIVEKGLLCSVGNKGKLDRFSVTLKEGITQFDVWQHPRVCFTDIPRDHLNVHAKTYGKFALGFSRKTILEWGGCPVWYINNHTNSDGISDGGNSILYLLHRFPCLADNIWTLVTKKDQKIVVAEELIQGKQAEDYVLGAMTSLFQMLSFVKEMSPHDSDNQQYLYEREWRIVVHEGKAFSRLTPEEKRELIGQNSVWGQPPKHTTWILSRDLGRAPWSKNLSFFGEARGKQCLRQ